MALFKKETERQARRERLGKEGKRKRRGRKEG
jgi:hypothetical protein